MVDDARELVARQVEPRRTTSRSSACSRQLRYAPETRVEVALDGVAPVDERLAMTERTPEVVDVGAVAARPAIDREQLRPMATIIATAPPPCVGSPAVRMP